jgi:hypothetical protein
METKFITSLALLSGLVACTPSADKETQQSLTAYTTFVDSVYAQNEVWVVGVDSTFMEVPTDPNDPTKIRIDTVVTQPEDRGHNEFMSRFKEIIQKEYEPLKAAVESKLDKMDERMKKQFEESKQKFESIRTP